MVIRITYSESWQEPSKAAEDESLNKADDVEQLPSLHVDAVDGKEDGDRAVDGNGESEHKEPTAIPKMITWSQQLHYNHILAWHLRPTQL